MKQQNNLSNIFIKAIYGDWREVTKEQAKEFVDFLLRHCQAVHPNELPKYINENKIKGITVEELLKGDDENER